MRRGFTLVELLAVIVILAVIALITIPAVMKMIDTSTTNSYRRSIDLYGKAISQGIISYESDMVEQNKPINITFENIDSYIEYEGNDVDCKDKTIYSDKTILLTECTVQDELVYAENGRGYGDENYYYYTNSKKKMKLIKYIEAVEEAIKDKNISGTCTIGEDKITCNNEDIGVKSKLENAIEGTITIENNKVKSYSNMKFATEKKTETNNEVPQVIDEQNTSDENNNNQNNNNEILATDEDYRGYYADVDGNGTVDGIIYADLGANITYPQSGDWYNEKLNYGQNNGIYDYIKENNLKEYIVSKEKYTEGKFGEKEIISIKKGSRGNARFYVMALEDFTTEAYTDPNDSNNSYPAYTTYYWYRNAYNSMPSIEKDTSVDFGKGYVNTGNMIRIWNNNGEEEGWTTVATQNKQDIWKHIQTKYQEGWYIPSRGEWASFANYLKEEQLLTNDCSTNSCNDNGNYDDKYELSGYYWSSSRHSASTGAWYLSFRLGAMDSNTITANYSVRLGVTF